MRIKLEACELWSAVDLRGVEFQVDRMAFDTICSAVPPEMVTALEIKDTVMDAWESIKTMHIGDDQIRKASA
jgi:tryptophan 2,3-dioxygenase